MVMVAESTHFDRLMNLICYIREPLMFVRSTSVVQWHGHERLLYIHVLRVAGTRLIARNDREMCNYFAQLFL